MRTFILVTVVAVLLVIAAAVGYRWYFAGQATEKPPVVMQVSDKACRDSSAVCRADHASLGEITLRFPAGAYYLHPFTAELGIKDNPETTIEKVILDMTMPGMDMGRNVFVLKAGSNNNSWQGKLLLPICVTGRVDWRVRLEITTDRQRYEAHFPLQVKRYQQR